VTRYLYMRLERTSSHYRFAVYCFIYPSQKYPGPHSEAKRANGRDIFGHTVQLERVHGDCRTIKDVRQLEPWLATEAHLLLG